MPSTGYNTLTCNLPNENNHFYNKFLLFHNTQLTELLDVFLEMFYLDHHDHHSMEGTFWHKKNQ